MTFFTGLMNEHLLLGTFRFYLLGYVFLLSHPCKKLYAIAVIFAVMSREVLTNVMKCEGMYHDLNWSKRSTSNFPEVTSCLLLHVRDAVLQLLLYLIVQITQWQMVKMPPKSQSGN